MPRQATDLPDLNEVLAAKRASNQILHALDFIYRATCDECGAIVEITNQPGMLAARKLLDRGWSAIGPLTQEKALCPECGLL